jgi:hypothetical protein
VTLGTPLIINQTGTMGTAIAAGQAVPAGSGLALIIGYGGAGIAIGSITDDVGNSWEVAVSTTAQRPQMIGICRKTDYPLAATDQIRLTASAGTPASGRTLLLAMSGPFDTVGGPVSNSANSNAPTITVPAEPGEVILGGWVYAGDIAISNANWPILGPAPTGSPVGRGLWQPASGTEVFTCNAASANAWAINAIRLVPAARLPVRVWDGARWRDSAAPAGARAWDGTKWGRLG